MRRNRGFTLIELLVVIAIIGILAAMLFPVFARARESARKTQCLANVKNIAIAVQMYLTDYDCFPPSEHRAEVVAWANDQCGCDSGSCCKGRLAGGNPYLRWPVILDDYVKNRQVWTCPSGRTEKAYPISGGYANGSNGDWWKELLDARDAEACPRGDPCQEPYPPGWGGTITDSVLQEECGSAGTGGVAFGIGVTAWLTVDEKTSEVKDPAKKVVCADAGRKLSLERAAWVAYPDFCRIDIAACSPDCWADWVNCTDTQQCGAGSARFGTDVQYRKDHAYPRHLGGSNIGFADGHAKWYPAETILTGGDGAQAEGRTDAPLEGLNVCGSLIPLP